MSAIEDQDHWTLEGVELWRAGLRFRQPIGTAAGVHIERPVIYVRLVTTGGEGWGESPALISGTSVDPDHEQVWEGLVASSTRLMAGEAALAVPGLPPGSPGPSRPPAGLPPVERWAWAALEMAAWDLDCRRTGQSLGERWGASSPVPVGALVGIPRPEATSSARGLAVALEAVERAAASGYRRVRMKIAPGWDVEVLRAVRERFASLPLQADANGAYRWEAGSGEDDVRRLVPLDELGLECLEQPLAPGDLAGHARLGEVLATPICLDESLVSVERLSEAVRLGACQVACIKPPRLGGLDEARRAVGRCREHGVGVFVGGMFETGLARAAHAAVSGLPGCTLAGDLSDPASYLDDPCGFPTVSGGQVSLWSAPGVGAVPRPETLVALGARRHWISRSDVGVEGRQPR